MEILGKSLQDYEAIRNDISVYEQKPIKTDGFNKAEENEITGRVEKRKIKRRKVAENNKLLKKRNLKKIKKKETEMFTKLRELDYEFKNLKNIKKTNNNKNVKYYFIFSIIL